MGREGDTAKTNKSFRTEGREEEESRALLVRPKVSLCIADIRFRAMSRGFLAQTRRAVALAKDEVAE
jgi:hypothetical protein